MQLECKLRKKYIYVQNIREAQGPAVTCMRSQAYKQGTADTVLYRVEIFSRKEKKNATAD